jgi:hypothetical protein
VVAHVVPERGGVGKGLEALDAHVGFDARVGADVPGEVAVLGEGLGALGTLVGALVRVLVADVLAPTYLY